MDFSTVKAITIPEGEVAKIEVNGVAIWEMPSSYKNWVQYSINADGTIYNNGLGYKDGYRIRSGGAEGAVDSGSVTGYILAKSNDIIRISGCNFDNASTTTAINVYDSSFSNLGQIVGNVPNSGYGIFSETAYTAYSYKNVVKESSNVWKWVVPPHSGITFIRVTGYTWNGTEADGSGLIVTVNEEII